MQLEPNTLYYVALYIFIAVVRFVKVFPKVKEKRVSET